MTYDLSSSDNDRYLEDLIIMTEIPGKSFLSHPSAAGIVFIAILAVLFFIALNFAAPLFTSGSAQKIAPAVTVVPGQTGDLIPLPAPDHESGSSLDYALEHRRSSRVYLDTPVSRENLSLILWSAQGITDPASGKRTAPSAMHTYPLTLYIAVSNVSGISPGVYTYVPGTQSLARHLDAAGKDRVLQAIGQKQVLAAPVTVIVSGNSTIFREMMQSSDDVTRHICLEAGHVVQNILLMETSRGMAGVPLTGFNATAVDEQLELSGNHHVVYAVTAAYPADL